MQIQKVKVLILIMPLLLALHIASVKAQNGFMEEKSRAKAEPGQTPYIEKDVTIETQSSEVTLSGTLSLPNGKGLHPAVLSIAGNGPHTHDQVISGTPMFRQMAAFFVRNGIAVLRVDKRGVGKSTGSKDIDASTFADFALDARACFNFLKKCSEINPKRIGLLGHSEGAIVAPMVAIQEPDVRFVILISPTAVNGGEIWNRQKNTEAKKLGVKDDILPGIEKQRLRIIEWVKTGKNDDATYYQLGHYFLAAHGLTEDKITPKLIDSVISDLRKKWYSFFFAYNLSETLRKLKTPTLALFGSADEQVSVEQNLNPLISSLVEAKNQDFVVTVLPDQDHFFLVFEGRRLEKHNFGKMEVSPVLLEAVTEWI